MRVNHHFQITSDDKIALPNFEDNGKDSLQEFHLARVESIKIDKSAGGIIQLTNQNNKANLRVQMKMGFVEGD